MKIIGLTGGIGSGKSTVAKMFKSLNVPIYIADDEAKILLANSKVIRKKVIALLGEDAYTIDGPNKQFIASKIFNNTTLLTAMNAIIHPKVASHFKRWVAKQDGPYCIKEAAILFENDGYKKCDATILVTAPKQMRIERVMLRDGVTKKQVIERMKNQWEDEIKIPLADYIIENIELKLTEKSVRVLHKKIAD
ncbi:dephospho-CoA kinase [Patiriisocius marinistellae]|uniref:Dephospho-CoA kinase n=1 Tax=Patiriisocius marinistellae TaxID=2494560 RepID=A0A5J4FVB2_9FLAO|nr:dephospho-CoA kinase [Patiriisocius marinistellae]GEQ86647.1 dephospho-CoA kinase [Patiriisocius marinistellae]